MASEQIEYCGECEHFETCKILAKEGRLDHCQYDEQSRESHRHLK